MYTDLTAETPQDKMQKYADVNDVAINTGYVSFIPNSLPVQNQDYLNTAPQIVDVKSMLGKQTQQPLIFQIPKDQPHRDPLQFNNEPTPIDNFTFPKQPSRSLVLAPPAKRAKQAYDYYVKEHKLDPKIAAGIVGNLYHESGLNPTSVENNGGNGRGIAQWDVRDRWQSMRKWAKSVGKDPDSLYTQLDYVLTEPDEQAAIRKTLGAKDVNEATMIFGKAYERPKESKADWKHRLSIANNLITT